MSGFKKLKVLPYIRSDSRQYEVLFDYCYRYNYFSISKTSETKYRFTRRLSLIDASPLGFPIKANEESFICKDAHLSVLEKLLSQHKIEALFKEIILNETSETHVLDGDFTWIKYSPMNIDYSFDSINFPHVHDTAVMEQLISFTSDLTAFFTLVQQGLAGHLEEIFRLVASSPASIT